MYVSIRGSIGRRGVRAAASMHRMTQRAHARPRCARCCTRMLHALHAPIGRAGNALQQHIMIKKGPSPCQCGFMRLALPC